METVSLWSARDYLDAFIQQFIPAALNFRMEQLLLASDELTLVLASSQTAQPCPICGQNATRVHSSYLRTFQDLPWGPLRLQLRVQVHRFFCQNPSCARRIFTERLPELAEPSARRTNRLRDALRAIGWALGGQAGARQCATHAMPVRASTLLSLLRREGVPGVPTARVMGVDDWSFQARQAGAL